MSETPTTRKFGLAAVKKGAKSKWRYGYVPAVLVATLILGTWCAKVSAQPPIDFSDPNVTGVYGGFAPSVIDWITFEQPPFEPWYSANSGGGVFTVDDVRVLTKLGTYLNDLVVTGAYPLVSHQNVQTRKRDGGPGKALQTGAAAVGAPGSMTILPSYAATPGYHNTQTTLFQNFENILLHELGHALGLSAREPGGFSVYGNAALDPSDPLYDPNDGDIRIIDGVVHVRFRSVTGVYQGYNTRLGRYENVQVRNYGTGINPATGVDYTGDPGEENWYVFDRSIPFRRTVYSITDVLDVHGDAWVGGTDYASSFRFGVAVDSDPASLLSPGASGTFAHPWDAPGGIMTYRSARSFFSELELTLFQDLGHVIDRDRFYGRSLYRVHTATINLTDASNMNYTHTDGTQGWLGDGTFGIGLDIVRSDEQNVLNSFSFPSFGLAEPGPRYFYDYATPNRAAPGNRVNVLTHLVSRGFLGTGIRIEGYNHNVTVGHPLDPTRRDILVAAWGDEGIGVLITLGNGVTLTNYGTIEATGGKINIVYDEIAGTWVNKQIQIYDDLTTSWIWFDEVIPGGVGVWFQAYSLDDNTATLNNYGTIRGSLAAIYIDSNFTVSEGTLNFYGGTVIEGHIYSSNVTHDIVITPQYERNPLTGAIVYDPDTNEPIIAASTARIFGFDFDDLTGRDIQPEGIIDLKGGTVYVRADAGISSSAELSDGVTPVSKFGSLIIGTLANPMTLVMDEGSILQVNLGIDPVTSVVLPPPLPPLVINESDTIAVTGTAIIAEGITIHVANPMDLNHFGPFTYRLLSAANLIYANNSATVLLGDDGSIGVVVAPGERISLDYTTTNVPDPTMSMSHLLLQIDMFVAGAGENVYNIWTGGYDNVWDVDINNVNEPDRINWHANWFQDGDAVKFNLNGDHSIEIDNSGGWPRIVSDMYVESTGTWTFIGYIYGTSGATTLLGTTGSLYVSDASSATFIGDNYFEGGLTMTSTGALTLFSTHTFEDDIVLGGGTTNVIGTVYDGGDYPANLFTTFGDLYVGVRPEYLDESLYLSPTDFENALASLGNNWFPNTAMLNLTGDDANTTAEVTARGDIFIGSDFGSLGIVTLDEFSTLRSMTGDVQVGEDTVFPPNSVRERFRGIGIVAGNGIIAANNVLVATGSILSPGDPNTLGRGDLGILTIDGNLKMNDGSGLWVDLLPWFDFDGLHDPSLDYSDKVAVTGSANIGEIDIDLTSLFPGPYQARGFYTHTYTLLTADAGLIYVHDTARILLNGEELATIDRVGRWKNIDWRTETSVSGNDLLFIVEGDLLENMYLLWTGNADNDLWDFASENWISLDPDTLDPLDPNTFVPIGPDAFVQYDTVIFWEPSAARHEIDIVGTKKAVSDMYVLGGTWIFNGNISGDAGTLISDATPTGGGTGGLYIASGSVTLNSDDVTGNKFDGGAQVSSGGSLTLNGDLNVFDVLLESGGKLQIGSGDTTGRLTGDILVDNGTGSVTFNHNAPNPAVPLYVTFLGNITDSTYTGTGTGDGVGSVTKRGDSVLFLLGENTYTGLTHVAEGSVFFGSNTNDIGAVTVASGTMLGGIADVNGDKATTITADGNVDNSGTLYFIKDLTVTGNVDNRNNAVIGMIDSFDVKGTLRNFGDMNDIVTLTAENVTNSGYMMNIGGMQVGTNLINSGYMVNMGSTQVGNNLINSGFIINVPDLTVGNSITNSGAGFLVNVHSISSDYFQNQGTIAGTKTITMGQVLTGYDQNNDPVYGKGTFINQGGMIVPGIIAVDLVQETYELNQIDTLVIDGNFINTNGAFVIGIDGFKNSTIEVYGDAIVNGGVVAVEVVGGGTNYRVGWDYKFLSVIPGIDPNNPHSLQVNTELTLDMINVNADLLGGILTAVLKHQDDDYWLSFVRAFSYSQAGKTMNQRAVGRYVDQVGIYPGGDYLQVLQALDSAYAGLAQEIQEARSNDEPYVAPSMDPLHKALDQMGGSIYGTMTTASFQNTVMLHNTLANVLRRDFYRLSAVENDSNPRYRGQAPPYDNRSGYNPSTHIWGMFYGNAGTMHSDGNAGKYSQGFSGIMIGYDRFNSKPQRYGLFISAGGGSLYGELGDRTLTTEFMIGPYMRQDTANTYLLVQAGIGNHNYDTRRRLVFGDPNDMNSYIDRTAKNEHDAFLATAHIEAGLKYRGGTLNLSPFVGVQYTGLTREAFTEHGADSLNLSADKATYSSFRAMFGMRFDSKSFRFFKGQASFYGNAAWMYEFEPSGKRHTEFTARFYNTGFVREPSFTVHGNDPGRDWVQTGFGLNYDVNSYFRGFVGYDAYANTNQVMHSANLGFVYQR